MTREDAIDLVHKRDGKFPWTYLGKPLQAILDPLAMTVGEFEQVCDAFTNRNLFHTTDQGALLKDRFGNLTKINYDNVSE